MCTIKGNARLSLWSSLPRDTVKDNGIAHWKKMIAQLWLRRTSQVILLMTVKDSHCKGNSRFSHETKLERLR